jgi:hypothetical protein
VKWTNLSRNALNLRDRLQTLPVTICFGHYYSWTNLTDRSNIPRGTWPFFLQNKCDQMTEILIKPYYFLWYVPKVFDRSCCKSLRSMPFVCSSDQNCVFIWLEIYKNPCTTVCLLVEWNFCSVSFDVKHFPNKNVFNRRHFQEQWFFFFFFDREPKK